MSIYQDIILDHYHAPRNFGHLKKPTQKITVNNPLCGDVITLEVIVNKNKIEAVAFWGVGCAVSKAASSMITEYMKGKEVNKLRKFSKEDMIKILRIELSPNRLKCGLLPWEALIKICQSMT